jgi:hypothetical protein
MEFGYPDCCITFFEEHSPKALETRTHWYTLHDMTHMPWAGTGFLPCPDCRKNGADTDFEKFVAEHIIPNRTHPIPFPGGH